eukprot:149503-Rhodomonas_salina.1
MSGGRGKVWESRDTVLRGGIGAPRQPRPWKRSGREGCPCLSVGACGAGILLHLQMSHVLQIPSLADSRHTPQ